MVLSELEHNKNAGLHFSLGKLQLFEVIAIFSRSEKLIKLVLINQNKRENFKNRSVMVLRLKYWLDSIELEM